MTMAIKAKPSKKKGKKKCCGNPKKLDVAVATLKNGAAIINDHNCPRGCQKKR